jgi:hypothetical protein
MILDAVSFTDDVPDCQRARRHGQRDRHPTSSVQTFSLPGLCVFAKPILFAEFLRQFLSCSTR